MVEGEKNILELLKADYKIRRLLVTRAFINVHEDSIEFFPYIEIGAKVLADISSLKTNDQALAVVEMRDFSVSDINPDKMIFVLDGISDPGNLGTIIRTLDWFGFDQVVCSKDTVDHYNPKVIGATMGSFGRVKVVYCDLDNFFQQYNGTIIGAEMSGNNIATYVGDEPNAIVMGSESHGISESVKAHLDESITIPKYGEAESLNVGVATGILCYSLLAKV